jgi:uncharacterized protein (TIGR00730 family)
VRRPDPRGVRHWVGVFGGPIDEGSRYRKAFLEFGEVLSERGMGVVHGGGPPELLAAVAQVAAEFGVPVWGVVPHQLLATADARVGVIQVASSHWRRNELLYLMSDSFVAFPGGLGVVSDLIQVATNGECGWPGKPTVLMNVDGYFDPVIECLNRARDEELAASCEAFLQPVGDVAELFDVLRSP